MVTTARDNWVNTMLQLLRVWLPRSHGVVFTCEHFATLAFFRGFPEPPDARAWGTVFQRAKRENLIEQYVVDGVPQTYLTSSKHRTPLWHRKAA